MLFYEIVHLIVDVVGGLLVGACLLRAWMQARRIPAANPIGGFVMALTDWIVRPLRRILPGYKGIDWGSVVAAFLITLIAVSIDFGVRYGEFPPDRILLATLVTMIRWLLYLAQLMILIVAVLSWVNPFSPLLPVFDALTAPLLAPLRRVMPRSGRIDFSPLVALLLIQIALIVVSHSPY
jgi:YggT family protein